jgi:hypothetical protein
VTGKTLQAILTLLTIAVLIISAVLLAGIFFPEDRIVTPRIDPVFSGKPPIMATSSYLFQEGMITISVSVNSSVYDGAKSADKSVTIIGNITESDWIADSYRAMVNDPAQEPLYQDLLFGFRKIRIEKDLDSDE